jgi:hypothetical protein
VKKETNDRRWKSFPTEKETVLNGGTCLLPNLLVANRANRDRPKQTKKRMVKLN